MNGAGIICLMAQLPIIRLDPTNGVGSAFSSHMNGTGLIFKDPGDARALSSLSSAVFSDILMPMTAAMRVSTGGRAAGGRLPILRLDPTIGVGSDFLHT